MGYEIEVKYRRVDHRSLIAKLSDRGAIEEPEVAHEDTYLNHPSRDFRTTNEALRIRRIGNENRITYKGPKLGGATKKREEIELSLTEGDAAFAQLARLFQNLGFQPVATIRKRRHSFRLSSMGRDVEVTLDTADGLGEFVEIETLATDESDLPAAEAAVLSLAASLGLTEVEPRSYLGMWLEHHRSASHERG